MGAQQDGESLEERMGYGRKVGWWECGNWVVGTLQVCKRVYGE
jgi:hypothetical protein